MNHFLDIQQLSITAADTLLTRALQFKQQGKFPNYSHEFIAHLFYEHSTRTRVSFEMAAKQLQMQVIHLDLDKSSESKGETIEDTLQNLVAMGIRSVVIRHQQNELPHRMAGYYDREVHVINAGDGTHEHPSQAMLDMMTILEHKPDLSSLKIAIVGDLRHSRVANSFQALCGLLGVGELMLVAPKVWQPKHAYFGQVTDSLEEGLADADIVMALRVQKERLGEGEQMDLAQYRQSFALTAQSMRYAKSNALVMHPGPLNRGIEIDDDIADGPRSLILQQVKNGVFMRMAILDAVLST